MKTYIVGVAVIILATSFLCFQFDYNLHQQQIHSLKFTCEEAAAAAAQFYIKEEYAEGYKVFNKEEGIKAAEHIIKSHLRLNDDFTPKADSYWTDRATYQIYFFDDSNTVYPALYEDDSSLFTVVITDPTVIVKINAGKGNYRIQNLKNISSSIQIAAHEWKERKPF